MIEVVTSRNALLYKDALEDMFHLRKRALCANALGQVFRGGFDKDRFDTDDAIYLLLTQDDGTVIGTHRLLPTTGPHIFSEELPELCDVRGMQRSEKTLELTRTCVDEEMLDRPGIERARNQLMVGLFEFCLRAGYDKFTLLMPTDTLFRYLLIGLNIRPLGIPVESGGDRQVAVIISVDRPALDVLRLALDVPEPQVDYLGAPAGDPLVLTPSRPVAGASL